MMKLSAVIGLFFVIGTMLLVVPQSADRIRLPGPWLTRDIGSVGTAGGATFANDALLIMGAGMDIWDTADEFRYVYQQVKGDCEIMARVVGVQNTDTWAKAGVMIRQNLRANSAYAMVVVTPSLNFGVAFQYRLKPGATSADSHITGLTAPYWVRIARSGNRFTAYRSATGIGWMNMGSVTIPMSDAVYIGLAVTSHSDKTLCMSTIDNVVVTP